MGVNPSPALVAIACLLATIVAMGCVYGAKLILETIVAPLWVTLEEEFGIALYLCGSVLFLAFVLGAVCFAFTGSLWAAVVIGLTPIGIYAYDSFAPRAAT